ncbi:ABC transporter permease [Spirillospora sp. CA-294931]|uniref:ABC transporter permease n=1 Tax=Spirillospora sp. CA-294931 TaxID=3240042 RepID=UPI003D905C7C
MNALKGTGGLVRLALRRDRVMLPAWVLGLVMMAATSASATADLYPEVKDRVQLASSNNDTPSLVALYGRVYDPTSLGAVSMLKMNIFGCVMAAILSILIVVRHTRAEEESGRLELVGATAVGRRAPLTAAVLTLTGTNLVLGLLAALGLMSAGLPAAGSMASGLAWACVGMTFGGIAAVMAQLTENARTATALSSAALGVFFMVRAIGDTAEDDGTHWLSWLSPIGWGQQFRPYAGDRWWVALLSAGFAVAAIAVAYGLVARRDLGAGILPDRPGPAHAAGSLRSPLALAWRLQRVSVVAWTVTFFVLGLIFGSMATNVGDMLDNEKAREFITDMGGVKGLSDSFLSAEMGIVAVLAGVFGVQAAMRPRGEESAQRAEALLSTSVSRVRWVGSHLAISLAGTALMLLATGLGAGLSYGAASDDMGQLGRLVGASLIQIPAVWVVSGVVVLTFGFVPRLAAAGWAALVVFLLIGQFGSVFNLPQAVQDVSPFAHTPRLPGGDWSMTPIVSLLAVAAALVVAGMYGFRRRDVPA